MQELTDTATVSFSAPAGTYYAGQYVPIVATFDYPVKITGDMTITVNGDKQLTPEEVGTTRRELHLPLSRDRGQRRVHLRHRRQLRGG